MLGNRRAKYQVYDHKQKMMFDVVSITRLDHSEGFVEGKKGDSGGEYFVTSGYLGKKYQLPDGKQIYRFSLREPTGLKDKNGKEIYEGDIMRGYNAYGEAFTQLTVIEWDEKEARWLGADWSDLAGEEVIGNIYEHPHLLKEA